MKFKQEIDYVSEKELDLITENKEEYYNGISPLDSRRFREYYYPVYKLCDGEKKFFRHGFILQYPNEFL